MIKELINLGLSAGEARVYLALVKIGISTVGPIMKESGVANSNVYEILERLQKKGLVSFIIKEKTRHYQAAPKEHLQLLLQKEMDEKQKLLNSIIPNIVEKNIQHQEAEIYIGKKGLRTAYQLLFSNTKKLDFFLTPKEKEKIADFYLQNKDIFSSISIRGVSHVSYRNAPGVLETKKNTQMRFVDFPIPTTVDIASDKVLFITWETLTGILITSSEIAQSFREYFETVWKLAKK